MEPFEETELITETVRTGSRRVMSRIALEQTIAEVENLSTHSKQ